METINFLKNRHSEKNLIDPAPSKIALENMFKAAFRVPDHGNFSPYYFYVIEKEGRIRFSELLQKAAIDENLGEKALGKAKRGPLSAPMIIVVVSRCKVDDYVSIDEQKLSAGCAAYALLLAAEAQGFSGIWRTGIWAKSKIVRAAFSCKNHDEIISFLYLGSPENQVNLSQKREKNTQDFVTYF